MAILWGEMRVFSTKNSLKRRSVESQSFIERENILSSSYKAICRNYGTTKL